MKTIIIVSFSNLAIDPRVNRQIRFLSNEYQMIAVGLVDPNIDNVKFISVEGKPKSIARKVVSALQLLLQQYENYFWSQNHILGCHKNLANIKADLIIANDIDTLPLALKIARGAKVLFDAHEYAPLEYEDRLLFRVFFQAYKTYLCNTYIPQVNSMITVCQCIADRYEKETGIKPLIITNAPDYEDIEPNLVNKSTTKIRLVHHGLAAPSRKIESMIQMMDYLDDRFELSLILVEGSREYLASLKQIAKRKSNIRFPEPVSMRILPKYLSQYDVGLAIIPPTNFNYFCALPNKFFEFIQARLAIVTGPSPEMAGIVQTYDCGIVAADFSAQTLAQCLMQLDPQKVNYYKQRSHEIARIMSAEQNWKTLLNLVEQVLIQ